jgi:hypothetical protein
MNRGPCCPRARGIFDRGLCLRCVYRMQEGRKPSTLEGALEVVALHATDNPEGAKRLAAWAINRKVYGVGKKPEALAVPRDPSASFLSYDSMTFARFPGPR